MKRRGSLHVSILAIFVALILAAGCQDDHSATGPTIPLTGVTGVVWSMNGRLTGFSDPSGCLGSRTIGQESSTTWSIYQTENQLRIETGDPLDDFPVYSGSLNGLQIDFAIPESKPSYRGICVSTFRSMLVGSFSADRLQLDAVETWIFRDSSGVDSALVLHWTGSKMR